MKQEWTCVSYDTNNTEIVFAWLQKYIEGEFSLSVTTILFRNPEDATFFKLGMANILK